MEQKVIRDEKNLFGYSILWNNEVLVVLNVDEANVYLCVSNASRYETSKSFATVLTVRGQQEGIVIL